MGRNDSDTDAVNRGQLEVSLDGQSWSPLMPESSGLRVEYRGNGKKGRFVRYRATAQGVPGGKPDVWTAIRDFKVNAPAAPSGGSVRGVRLRQFEDAGYEVGQVVHFHGRKVLDGGFVEGGRFRGYWRSDQGHQAVERLLLPAGGDSGRVQAESCQQGWEVRRQRSCRGFQHGNVPPGGAVSGEGGDSL